MKIVIYIFLWIVHIKKPVLKTESNEESGFPGFLESGLRYEVMKP